MSAIVAGGQARERAQIEHVEAKYPRLWTVEESDRSPVKVVHRLHITLELGQVEVFVLGLGGELGKLLVQCQVFLAFIARFERGKIFQSLHDELVKDKEKIGLITHECSCDVFVVGWIELLLRRL